MSAINRIKNKWNTPQTSFRPKKKQTSQQWEPFLQTVDRLNKIGTIRDFLDPLQDKSEDKTYT